MFNDQLDERMVLVRGKGLLYGFFLMGFLFIIKTILVTFAGFEMESQLRTDFAIVYVCLFVVSLYMLINDGLSETHVIRSKYLFLIISVILISTTLFDVFSNGNYSLFPTLGIRAVSLAQCLITVGYTWVHCIKAANLKKIFNSDSLNA